MNLSACLFVLNIFCVIVCAVFFVLAYLNEQPGFMLAQMILFVANAAAAVYQWPYSRFFNFKKG